MEAKKMAMSSGIETIVQCLSKAVEATRSLNSNLSQNLCFALNIANGEAGRVAEVPAQGLCVAKDRKDGKDRRDRKDREKGREAARAAMPAKQPQQPKSRRKASTLNGAVAR